MLGVPRMRKQFIAIAAPELNRDLNACERFRREGVTDGGRGDHGGRDPRVVDERSRCCPCTAAIFLYFATGPFIGIGRTMGRAKRQVEEMYQAADVIARCTDAEDAQIIMGAVIDENMLQDIRVTVLATGFGPDIDRVLVQSIPVEKALPAPVTSTARTPWSSASARHTLASSAFS